MRLPWQPIVDLAPYLEKKHLMDYINELLGALGEESFKAWLFDGKIP